jgi:hypothetical protein
MLQICWRVLTTMVLYCGPPQPADLARNTFAIETGRYDPALAEFDNISRPILLPPSPETALAFTRLRDAWKHSDVR